MGTEITVGVITCIATNARMGQVSCASEIAAAKTPRRTPHNGRPPSPSSALTRNAMPSPSHALRQFKHLSRKERHVAWPADWLQHVPWSVWQRGSRSCANYLRPASVVRWARHRWPAVGGSCCESPDEFPVARCAVLAAAHRVPTACTVLHCTVRAHSRKVQQPAGDGDGAAGGDAMR